MHTTVLHQSYSFKLILQKQLLRKMQPKVHQEDTNSKFLIRLIVFSSKCSLECPRLWQITVTFSFLLQVNICQKHLFLHQLTHNMTADCSLNYEFNTLKFHGQNMLRTKKCSECQNKKQFVYTTCSELGIFMY